jgi:thymidylate synthase (FAD)
MNTKEYKILDHGFVRYIDHMGSDLRIVEAARVSYDSKSKGDEADKKLLHFLLKNKHTSPFEQCRITFNIRMPIFVMRQFVRHRMQSINEVSARYTVLPDVFYIPEKWRAQDNKNKQGSLPAELNHLMMSQELLAASKHCYFTYERLLEMGAAKEMARIILPVNIYTEIYTTWDLNNLLKYFSLRDDPHAQWEHQEFARAMKNIVKELFPWTMEAYDIYLNPLLKQ